VHGVEATYADLAQRQDNIKMALDLSQVGTPAAWHQEFFQTTNATLQQGEEAQKNVEASVSLVNE
jgi:hypothetical protein